MHNFKTENRNLTKLYLEMTAIISLFNYKKRQSFLLTKCSVLAILLTLYSCDKEHTKVYIVENRLNVPVEFKFTAMTKVDTDLLPINSITTIYINQYFFGTVGVSDDRNKDDVSDFSVKYDTIVRPVAENKWKYEEINKYSAKYTLVIDTSLIK